LAKTKDVNYSPLLITHTPINFTYSIWEYYIIAEREKSLH
jgi:hypothetical protein